MLHSNVTNYIHFQNPFFPSVLLSFYHFALISFCFILPCCPFSLLSFCLLTFCPLPFCPCIPLSFFSFCVCVLLLFCSFLCFYPLVFMSFCIFALKPLLLSFYFLSLHFFVQCSVHNLVSTIECEQFSVLILVCTAKCENFSVHNSYCIISVQYVVHTI